MKGLKNLVNLEMELQKTNEYLLEVIKTDIYFNDDETLNAIESSICKIKRIKKEIKEIEETVVKEYQSINIYTCSICGKAHREEDTYIGSDKKYYCRKCKENLEKGDL